MSSDDSTSTSSQESITSEQQQRINELSIRDKELNNNRVIEITKIITTGIVVTLVPAIINAQIQSQKIEIERLQGEQRYLESFAERALQDDLRKRISFAEYISIVAHSKDSRTRWEIYYSKLQERFKRDLAKVQEEEQQIRELKNQLEELSSKNANQEEINQLYAQVLEAEKDVRNLRRETELETESVLARGDTGPDVISLQKRLQELGFMAEVATGYYGPSTEQALIRFQREKGLIPDGIGGTRTLIELGLTPVPARYGYSENSE